MSEQLLATVLLGNSFVPSTVTYSMSIPTVHACLQGDTLCKWIGKMGIYSLYPVWSISDECQ